VKATLECSVWDCWIVACTKRLQATKQGYLRQIDVSTWFAIFISEIIADY